MTALRRLLLRPPGRRLTAGLALVAYLVVAAGVPVPAFPRKDTSVPFPCQDLACGCRSAEQCWRHCCCFTAAEHWAWARARGIEPPPYATKPSPADEQLEGPTVCCHCEHAGKSCCSGQHAANHGRAAPGAGWHWTTGADVLRCRGLSTLWVTTGAALPPEPPLAWSPFPLPRHWLGFPGDPLTTVAAPPPLPPPRLPLA
jgi:hypothetical protein